MPINLDITQPVAVLIAATALWLLDALLGARRARNWRSRLVAPAAIILATLLALSDTPLARLALLLLASVGGVRLLAEIARRDVLSPRRPVRPILRALALLTILLLIARPVWRRTEFLWQRPVLVVLLDQSGSMAVRDAAGSHGPLPPRSERVATALRSSRAALDLISSRYDPRILKFSARAEPANDWSLPTPAGLTGLAAALESAGGVRSATLEPAAAVLLVSDGAETVADAAAVRTAAAELAARRLPLLIAGVGPVDNATPLIELEPLVAPPMVRVRDSVRVSVAFRVQGFQDQTLPLELIWDSDVAERESIEITQQTGRIERSYSLITPGAGAHRLTARVTAPTSLGGAVCTVSTVVDVADERVRILIVERVPQTESAFVARALSGEEHYEVVRRFLFDNGPGGPSHPLDDDAWTGFDVVILGRTGGDIPLAALDTLAEAVAQRRVGAALAGGRELLNDPRTSTSNLASLCPTALVQRRSAAEQQVLFQPTSAGQRHPILAGLTGWDELPPLTVSAELGPPKPAASVLAADPERGPLLAVHNFGRGRCAAVAWDSTWPWSLASDAGLELHKRFWRQLVAWLANRQPQAWIIADQGEYPLIALSCGERRVRIDAGLNAGAATQSSPRAYAAELSIRPAGADEEAWRALPAQTSDRGWTAEWPPRGEAQRAAAGEYELRVQLREEASPDALTATTRISVVADDLERRPPTSNLPLLRDLAKLGASAGNRYATIDELPKLLAPLTLEDRRQRIANVRREDLLASQAWPLLGVAVAALAIDWILRRRAGGV